MCGSRGTVYVQLLLEQCGSGIYTNIYIQNQIIVVLEWSLSDMHVSILCF